MLPFGVITISYFSIFPFHSPITKYLSAFWRMVLQRLDYMLGANSGKREGEREEWRDRNSDSERYKLVFHG